MASGGGGHPGVFETERVTEEDEDGLSGYRNGEELKETQAKGTA